VHHCMNKEELHQFIDFKNVNKEVDASGLKSWIEDAHNWQVELGCVNYLLSQVLERKAKDGENCLDIIKLVYRLDEQLFLRVQECDRRYVEYMLTHLRQSTSSLEDELVVLHVRMCEHIYEHALRY